MRKREEAAAPPPEEVVTTTSSGRRKRSVARASYAEDDDDFEEAAPREKKPRWMDASDLLLNDARIAVRQDNPKKAGSKSALRYDAYKAATTASAASRGCAQPRTSIWPIMTGASHSLLKPPFFRHRFAALLAAATTDASSRTKGMR